MSRVRTAGVALPLAAILSLPLGCGSSEQEIAPVSGVILLDGEPLPGTTVVFQPVAKAGSNIAGPGSSGTCDSEGRYQLQLQTAEGQDGAVVGNHKVSIYSKKSDQPSNVDVDVTPQVELFPERYNYRSTLTFDVPSGGTDEADFKLTTEPGA